MTMHTGYHHAPAYTGCLPTLEALAHAVSEHRLHHMLPLPLPVAEHITSYCRALAAEYRNLAPLDQLNLDWCERIVASHERNEEFSL